MMNGQQPVYDGNTPVSVNLSLNTWNAVLSMIAEAPWKTANPIMTEVQKQIASALEKVTPVNQPEVPMSLRSEPFRN